MTSLSTATTTNLNPVDAASVVAAAAAMDSLLKITPFPHEEENKATMETVTGKGTGEVITPSLTTKETKADTSAAANAEEEAPRRRSRNRLRRGAGSSLSPCRSGSGGRALSPCRTSGRASLSPCRRPMPTRTTSIGGDDDQSAGRRSIGGLSGRATLSPRRPTQCSNNNLGEEQLSPPPVARKSYGGRTSRSPLRRGVRRAVSMSESKRRDPSELFTPHHRTLSPCRSSMSKRDSSSSTRRQIPRRQVSFGDAASVDLVEKQYMDESEKKELWYDNKELKKLKKKVQKIVRQKEELDETEDCWRGLETYVKQLQALSSDIGVTEEKLCNQIVLQLMADDDSEEENNVDRAELQRQVQKFMNNALQTGRKQADQDAMEAHAIYMETMDSNQVTACFKLVSRGA